MNATELMSKLNGEKWMMSSKDFYSFYKSVEKYQEMRVGGLYGKIFGNPMASAPQTITVSTNETNNDISNGDTAIITINGILVKGASSDIQEGLNICDVDEITHALQEAADNPSITSIILCFNSPGGQTIGIEELGRLIDNIDREVKPVYCWTETSSNSASYWLMAQGRKLGMTYSASVGNVGVYMLLLDLTKQMAQDGITVNAISSGKYKLMGHDFVELKPDERTLLESDVKKQHEKFNQVILNKRPDVNPNALESLSYEGLDALENNLVDVVCDSFQEFISEIYK